MGARQNGTIIFPSAAGRKNFNTSSAFWPWHLHRLYWETLRALELDHCLLLGVRICTACFGRPKGPHCEISNFWPSQSNCISTFCAFAFAQSLVENPWGPSCTISAFWPSHCTIFCFETLCSLLVDLHMCTIFSGEPKRPPCTVSAFCAFTIFLGTIFCGKSLGALLRKHCFLASVMCDLCYSTWLLDLRFSMVVSPEDPIAQSLQFPRSHMHRLL